MIGWAAVTTEASPRGPDGASSGPQEVRLLSDTPLDDEAGDVLGLGALADAFAELIDTERTATPLTLAISAPWAPARDHDVALDKRAGMRVSARLVGEAVAVLRA